MKSDRELKINLRNLEFELLVPAGDKNTAKKAVDFGADAIYIGYSKFGARASAGNSVEDLIETIEYAHKFGVRVYITVNTILKDDELKQAEHLIKKLYKIKADAIIIQDFGLLNIDLPPIRLHASTQCHNNTLEKIKFLEKTGFKRVILPRETTLEEIREIKKNTDIELENFIHGALCVSYSGQCYLSCYIGGRSANRGECAQPCRRKYSLYDEEGNCLAENKYLLSLKDFNLSKRLEELILAGITSFKIEGRLKNEAYVENVTAYYRQKLDEILKKYDLKRVSEGNCNYDFTPDLNKTFNRGFCEFNLDGEKKKTATIEYTSTPGEFAGVIKEVKNNYFILKKAFNFNNGDGISFYTKDGGLSGTYINKCEGNKVYPAEIKNITPGMKIYRNFDKGFDDKLKNSKTERKIEIKIRVRETDFAYLFFAQDMKDNASTILIPKPVEIANNEEKSFNTLKTQLAKTGGTEFNVKTCDIKLETIPFIKISEINEIRRKLIDNLQRIRRKNYKTPPAAPEINTAEYPVKELDYKSNIYNDKAQKFYEQRGCKVKERAFETLNDLKSRDLMTSKYCIKNELGICPKQTGKTGNKKLRLKDEFNKTYLVEFVCSECVMKVQSPDN